MDDPNSIITDRTQPVDWGNKRCQLRGLFSNGSITGATRKELEWYLVILANSAITGSSSANLDLAYKMETEEYSNVIRHLLQVRIAEELHLKSAVFAGVAIAISVLGLFHPFDFRKDRAATATPHYAPTAIAPAALSATQQSPAPSATNTHTVAIPQTNSTAVSSGTSTNP